MGAAQALTWNSCLQLAHAIRLLLEFTDTAYQEKRYTCGEGKTALGCQCAAALSQAGPTRSLSLVSQGWHHPKVEGDQCPSHPGALRCVLCWEGDILYLAGAGILPVP